MILARPSSPTVFRLIVLSWLVATLSPISAWGGSVLRGAVKYQGEQPVLRRSPVTVDTSVCGTEIVDQRLLLGKRGGIKNAVVYLQGKVEGARAFETPKSGFVIDQKRCLFDPHVIVLPPEGALVLRNEDQLSHRFRTRSRTNPVISVASSGSQREVAVRFDFPEIFELTCDIHPWMSAWVVVAENPYLSVTDDEGHFEIKDVPAGDYNVIVWQEVLGTQSRRVLVHEGRESKIDFKMEARNVP